MTQLDKCDLETLQPHQLGWLHRDDLDNADAIMWETPNGAVFACLRDGPRCIVVRLRNRYVLVEVLP